MPSRVWGGIISAATLLTLSLAAPQMARAQLSAHDRKFAAAAAQGGVTEVVLGRMAMRRGGSRAVREFGRRMREDHSRANAALKKIGRQKNLSLPAGMNQEQKDLYARLARLSGPAFDRLYTSEMVEDHEKDVREFAEEAHEGRDASVKAFAATNLPVLREHLAMARRMERRRSRAQK